jgi:dipeptidyl-peptidase-4
MRVHFCLVLCVVVSGCSLHRPSATPSTQLPSFRIDTEFLAQYAATRRFSAGRPTSIKVTPKGDAVLFLRSGPRSFVQDLYAFDTATGQERVLLTADQILQGADEHLTAEEKARRERTRQTARGVTSYHLSKDGRRILVPLSGKLYVIERDSRLVTELPSEGGFPLDPQFSPDATKVACVRNNDLYVIDIADRTQSQLTTGGGGEITHGLSEFVAQEEMGRHHGFWWSPDSQRLVFQRTDTSGVERMHIMELTRPENAPNDWPYPRPGKPNAKVALGIVPVSGGETTWVPWDGEAYPYLATVKWTENAPLTILVQNRTQTEELLLSVDEHTGYTTKLLTETDPAWINLDQDMPRWLEDGSAFLWTTERNGAWQLELRGRCGKLLHAVTPVGFRLKGLISVHDDSKTAYLSGGEDPTQSHVVRVRVDDASAAIEQLTQDWGQHGFSFGKDHSVYVYTYSGAEANDEPVVRRADGTEIGRLTSVAEEPPFMANLELTTVGNDPVIHAAIIRPRDFSSRRKYPVIVSVYGGPHAQTVSASPRRYIFQQWMADHGFIIVSFDGRGTPNRGRDWERVIKGDLIRIPLDDQVSALQALGRQYRELDLDRVGIYGWSFGGYFAAHAVMQRPDVYHVGIAGAPVCDWLDYDTHYTERYMGLPDSNAEGYRASAVQTYADRLRRPLMIIHGTADDNVYFLHALKMSDALFKAGKPHEFLPLSGFTHMVPDPLVTQRLYGRILGFLMEHLGGPT